MLFANRTFLYKFHSHIAQWVAEYDWIYEDDATKYFRRDRKESAATKRVAIPVWAQRAVFFRDRGRCCNFSVTSTVRVAL